LQIELSVDLKTNFYLRLQLQLVIVIVVAAAITRTRSTTRSRMHSHWSWLPVCCSLLVPSNVMAQVINFDGANFPCISYNIASAQAAGATANLNRTTNAATIAANRTAACGGAAADVTALNNAGGPGTPASCDEYPFASSTQGGAGAQALIVPAFENQAQGGALAQFYQNNNIANNGAYTVTTSNVPAVGANPGQIHIVVLASGNRQCWY
jgi:hypothetical protein